MGTRKQNPTNVNITYLPTHVGQYDLGFILFVYFSGGNNEIQSVTRYRPRVGRAQGARRRRIGGARGVFLKVVSNESVFGNP